jgi:hypothetical protein
MREIKLLVTLHVDECEPEKPVTQATMERAAVEAVDNALTRAYSEGFDHGWEDYLSITPVVTRVYNTDTTTLR